MKHTRTKMAILALGTVGMLPVWAQTSGTMDHSTMDHSTMDHSTMDHSTMDHSKMGHGQTGHESTPATKTPTTAPATSQPAMKPTAADDSKMDHGSMGHGGMDHGTKSSPTHTAPTSGAAHAGHSSGTQSASGMDHGDMQMQGGKAPPDARDPHAYSAGNTLDSGDYALPPSQRLRLADEHRFGSLLVDSLEKSYGKSGNSTAYDAQAWYGTTFDRLVVKAEGEVSHGEMKEGRTEVLWGHAIAPFWDSQLGVRYDTGEGPDRSWLAFGIQGLAPYWFEVDAAVYLGEQGRTALRVGAEYDLLLTQRLILQPRAEFSAYGKSDDARGLGSGLAESSIGLRLRYEFSRQFAPYLGVERASKYGQTARMAREDGESDGETRWVAGVRFWF